MLCLSGFELYSRWVPLSLPVTCDLEFVPAADLRFSDKSDRLRIN